MATGDRASAAGLPIVLGTSDIRNGYNAINGLADALVTYIGKEIDETEDKDPNARNIFAGNIEAHQGTNTGPVISVQNALSELYGRNSQNLGAKGPDGQDTSIQSVLDLIWAAIRGLSNSSSATSAPTPEES